MLRRNVPMTIFLFLIMTLHATTLGCFQWPHTFLSKELTNFPILYKSIFYATALIVSVLHQPISRRIGLKMELAAGVISSAMGILFFIAHATLLPATWVMILSMILLGISMLSVINCLLTYVILVFSNKTLLGIIALFAFGNAGMMLAPQMLRLGGLLHLKIELVFCIVTFLLMYGAGILILFDEPSYAQDPSLQVNTYLKKEMPVRFPLYLFGVMLYGLIESTFSLWGEELSRQLLTFRQSQIAASSFWFFLIVGQVALLFILQRFDLRKVLPIQCALIFGALVWLLTASNYAPIVLGMTVGGLGCSAIFGVTLYCLIREVFFFSYNNRDRYLTLVENGVSWMTASYMFTIGLTDIVTDWLDQYSRLPFLLAALFIVCFAAIAFYLNRTRPQES